MAEVLAIVGVIASIAQLTDFGFKLSVKLFAFSQTATTADESIKAISSDISLTSTVLQELRTIISADQSRLVSPAAISAIEQTIAECLKEFEQLDKALDKTLGSFKEKGKGKKGLSSYEKFKWPFKQPKMDLSRSNLDRLKTSLSLMLQVLNYARDVAERKSTESALAYQKQLIEALARSQKATEERYHALQHTIESHDPPPYFNSLAADTAPVSQARDLDDNAVPNNSRSVNQRTVSLIGELLVCFQLLEQILENYKTSRKRSDFSALGYEHLAQAIEAVKLRELERAKSTGPGIIRDEERSDAIQLLLGRIASLAPRKGAIQQIAVETDELSFISPVPQLRSHPALSPPTSRTAAPRANIGAAVDVMGGSINEVAARGERLDVLQDKRDSQTVSAQEFRTGANRVRSTRNPLWRSTFNSITAVGILAGEKIGWVGGQSDKGLQALEHGFAEARARLFAEKEQPKKISSRMTIAGSPYAIMADKHDEPDEGDEEEKGDIVADLLAKWTVLPAEVKASDVNDSQAVEGANADEDK